MLESKESFIKSQGVACQNWRGNWSFVNHRERFVLFGAWDHEAKNGEIRILSEDWAFDPFGGKNGSYAQALEHIRLIEEEGYQLKIYRVCYAKTDHDAVKIKRFFPETRSRSLKKAGRDWYAVVVK